MNSLRDVYQFILEMNKLKEVFRNTYVLENRKESTAEHSWSASMITLILMGELKKEFGQIDELKIIKLALIHDIVEIYAGDVLAFDIEARKDKTALEAEALKKLTSICPEFGQELEALWQEFEEKQSIESKIAKAADAICPIFLRLKSKQSYIPINVTLIDMEKIKLPLFLFSQTFIVLYTQLKKDLLREGLILST